MERARGAYRFFFDADASTPIEELEKAWPRFDDGADIVVGSRSLRESNVEVHQAWYRENMGRVFNLCLRILGLTHMPDTQCGFKGFTAAACDVVLPRQTIDRFAFDAELLYVAELHSLRIDQIPVRWINSRKSRLNPVTDSAAMFFEILGIRLNQLLGKYR
jgi:dolichyl-phosphate beta-glucosyltransferase